MVKFRIRYYHKGDAMMTVNGGAFIITDNEYVIKCFLKTVARYKIENTNVSRLTSTPNALSLNDGEKQINLYFFSKTAGKVYETLGL